MTNVKARIAALSLLDRALTNLAAEELLSAIEALPDEHREALGRLAGFGADADEADQVDAVRLAAQRGRVGGDLERIAVLLTDAALADCIKELGSAADEPSEEDLQRVLPGVVERHGLHLTQLMLASVVAGEAAASATIVRLLKGDAVLALPPAPPREIAPKPEPLSAEQLAEREQVRERRRAERKRKQAEQAARRAQAARRG